MSNSTRHIRLAHVKKTSHFVEVDSHGETGFTLVELIVVIAIMPIIIGGIAVAMITVFTNSNNVSTNISQSSDAQQVSSAFVADIQSASSLTTTKATSSIPAGPNICATATQLGLSGANPVLSLVWADGTTEVSYIELPDGSNTALYRNLCRGGITTSPSTTVISRDATPLMTAIVAGSPCPSTLNQGATCPVTSSWQTAAGTAYVKLLVTEPVTHSGSAYTYTLLASPRTSSPSSTGITGGGTLPLLLLGGTGQDYGCNENVNVAGQMVMDSTNGGVSSSGTINATGGFYTADTTNPSAALGGGGTYVPSGTPSSGPPIPDPYANLQAPAQPAQSPTWNGPVGGTFQPGYYPNGINTGGTLAPGFYYLNGSLNAGSGTLTGTNVFIYITGGGTFDTNGSGTVDLTGSPNPPSPVPAGFVIWQATSGTDSMKGTGSVDLSPGVFYAPGATLDISGAGKGFNFTVGQLMMGSMKCSGGGGGKKNFGLTVTGAT